LAGILKELILIGRVTAQLEEFFIEFWLLYRLLSLNSMIIGKDSILFKTAF
jgi:hypothetical protein